MNRNNFEDIRLPKEVTESRSYEISDELKIERDKWFLSILKDLKVGHIESQYNTYVSYNNSNNKFMFQYFGDGLLRCSYDRIWSIFKFKFEMNDDDTKKYIEKKVSIHLFWQDKEAELTLY
jgi:hypothetical protein